MSRRDESHLKIHKNWLYGLAAALLLGLFVFAVAPRVQAATGCFPDTAGHWSETFVCFLADKGIVGGYPDGTYRPDNTVTRAEVAVFVKKIYDLARSNDDDTLAGLSCSTDQIARWDGSAWVCAADETGSGGSTYTKSEVDSMINDLQNQIDAQQSEISTLQDKLASVTTENGGDDVVFSGVNVHIRNGSGGPTATTNGQGNLIIGYNGDAGSAETRTGSHNIVIGSDHSYSSYGGIVMGVQNTISARYAFSGGASNVAQGKFSAVLGGAHNSANGDYSSITGGEDNTAGGGSSSISGGQYNTVAGEYASITGGNYNDASGNHASVAGGEGNLASGREAVVISGINNTASGQGSVVVGGGGSSSYANESWADYSVVVGGRNNTAGDTSGVDRTFGKSSVVLGGYGNEATEDLSSISGGYSNTASGYAASVSGGRSNTSGASYTVIGGGYSRSVSDLYDWRAGTLHETQ